MLAISAAINVFSQTVSLDNTFGDNGNTRIPNTSSIDFFDFDSHGSIVAVGITLLDDSKCYLTIAKTSANGIVDESFGENGLVKITDYHTSYPVGLKITNDNKIIVVGSFTKVQFEGIKTIMMRFNEDGSLDENFGDKGMVNLNFNNQFAFSNADDFMLIAYWDSQGYNIVKYNDEGEIDRSFGENGVVSFTNVIYPYCMKILSDNSIIVAGTYNNSGETELGVCKLTPNGGELDTNFADGGIWHMNTMKDFDLSYEYFSNILEDNNGNIILSGSGLVNSQGWSSRAFLSKFSPDGMLDTGFGENGFYCFDFLGNDNPVFHIENKYITAGWYNNEVHKIIYVDDDGGSGDYVYTSDIYYFQAMKLQGDNKIILGGGYKIDDLYRANFALQRIVVDLPSYNDINNYSSKELTVFPNPVKEILYFSNDATFEIIDIQGKVILKSITPVNSINVRNLKNGFYFIRLDNSVVRKFIKK